MLLSFPVPPPHLPCKLAKNKEPTSGLEPLTCSLGLSCSLAEEAARARSPLYGLSCILACRHPLEAHLPRAVGQQGAEPQLRMFCALETTSKGCGRASYKVSRLVYLPGIALAP